MENENLKVTNLRWYPTYHIAAPKGWVNDPNGFSVFGGKYHFFYQHYPHGVDWGPMHWGHVVSKDLVNWEHLPIALMPGESYDNDGVFSGSGIEKDGKFYLLYTGNISLPDGGHAQKQALAISDDGINFIKSEKNPVIDVPQDVDMSGVDFRDPKVWKHDGKYYVVIGSKTADQTKGEILIFDSNDLENWNYKNISARAEGNQGVMWECPNFAEIGDKDVLIISPIGIEPEDKKFLNNMDVIYSIGKLDYDSGIFSHGDFDMVDYGFDFYAPQITKMPDGRNILIGWLSMWNVPQPEKADGWTGQMTIPRELKIKNGKLFSKPINELKSLRTDKKIYKNLNLDKETKLDGIFGETGELCIKIDTKKNFSIDIRNALKLSYNSAENIFKIIRHDSVDENLNGEREAKISPCEELNIRIYIDKSSAEIFLNDGEIVFSVRIYPEETSTDIIFIPEDENFAIKEVKFFNLKKSFPQPSL